ncbi:S8 family serine peptidase [Leucobacter insecticola]|uniref:S8 family serine peptidase n=1 Tax=Leucobacter insecticola TaxID=2714934 RepID=A0A6G8FG17_9MICO|nr:S8 family serine peptidase [Leucobacter insecticola]QIM15294.1 S8 family serine peptidase [Leucobacter insecticola]
MITRGMRGVAVSVLAAVLCFSGGGVAVADDSLPSDARAAGQWYVNDWYKFDDLQAAGATGAGVKIAIVDEAIYPDAPELAGANIRVMGSTCIDRETGKPVDPVSDDPELAGHGTNIAAILVGNGVAADGGVGAHGIAPEAEIMFYGVGELQSSEACVKHDPTVKPGEPNLVDDLVGAERRFFLDGEGRVGEISPEGDFQNGDAVALGVRAAIRDGADVVSISVESGLPDSWIQVLSEAMKAGVPIVKATLNPDQILEGIFFNDKLNGFVTVGGVEKDGEPLTDPKTHFQAPGGTNLAVAAPSVNLLGVVGASGWGPRLVHGTSYATPLVAGTIALGLQKFPEATANQVLQAMLRTTGTGEAHDLDWISDNFGYGYLNPSGLLVSDPLQYPDENPVFVSSLDDPRCTFASGRKGTWLEAQGGVALTEAEAMKLLKAGEKPEWACEWAGFPTPYDIEEYWASRAEPDSPTSGADEDADGGLLLWLAIGGGALLLGVIAVAVIVPLAVSRSRRQRAAQQPVPAPYMQQTFEGRPQPPGLGRQDGGL